MGTTLQAYGDWDQAYRETPQPAAAHALGSAPSPHHTSSVTSFLLYQAQLQIRELEKKLSDMSKLAHEDSLTGLLNRRGFDSVMTRELARARRQQSPLSLALLDIDDFKRINDRHGHAVGDMALQHFARVIAGALRKTDTLARLGGEEFVIVLPDTPLQHAHDTLARIQRTLVDNPLKSGKKKIGLTFSAGLTHFDGRQDLAALIDAADAGMYEAKNSGKDRILVV